MPESSPENEIRLRINKRGKIPFAEYMELALYHPNGGYYTNTSAFGADGDFYTSPATHPAFGALIALQCRQMWEYLGKPFPFHIVEIGAGTGLLSRDVLNYTDRLSDDFASSITYIALDRYAPDISISESISRAERIISNSLPLRDIVGCIISNELLDSFPTHCFEIQEGKAKEIYVTLDSEGQLAEDIDDPSTPLIAERIGSLSVSLPEGFIGEVNLNIRPWMQQVSKALARGFLITIDYGYEARQMYSSARSSGTIQTYYRHTHSGSPYQRAGRQDITAHVDFSLVSEEGDSVGLGTLALQTQTQFLKSLGFDEMLLDLRASGLPQHDRDANVMAMRELVKPGGLGDFKVLIQEKQTGAKSIADLIPAKSGEALESPLLRQEHISLLESRYPHVQESLNFDELWPFGNSHASGSDSESSL